MGQTIQAPLNITDNSNVIATIIGRGVSGAPVNPASVIEAASLILYGNPGVNGGPPRVVMISEPGVIELNGDDNTQMRLDTSGALKINDAAENTRVSIDATGNVTVSDATGAFSITLNPQAGQLSVLNTNPGFASSVVLDFAGGVTVTDSFGNTSIYKASGWTVNGDAGLSGNLTVQGDIFLPGADCAEQFEAAELTILKPGTVVVVDDEGAIRECTRAYDRRVVGVVSGAGHFHPGIILGRKNSPGDSSAAVALIGKVFCNVDTENAGPVAVGDLLTTSDVPGHAMRADDRERAFGAVLGKALGALASGRGIVPLLIALQ
jgi:hypothetical protein